MERLNRIVNYLIINSSSLHDIGLFNGKMGISIFFFHYAEFIKEKIYKEFAEILLDQVLEDITTYTPVNLQDGLCGIGWGIEYLAQQEFIKGNTDEILAELDMQIMNSDVRRLSDNSISSGLGGIIHYWLSRYKGNKVYPFDKQYWIDLKKKLIENRMNFTDPSWIDDCLDYFQTNKERVHILSIPAIIRNNLVFDDLSEEFPLGLNNGLAGFGLKKIIG